MFSSGRSSSPSLFLKSALGFCPFVPGYAVTAGHFSHPSATDVVGGAPQDEGIGKVRGQVGGTARGQAEGRSVLRLFPGFVGSLRPEVGGWLAGK